MYIHYHRGHLQAGRRVTDEGGGVGIGEKLLPVIDILYIRDATQMYKCMNNLAPKYLTQFL